ncbi:lytic transglycosylase domain-containing protein [Photobacterium sp. BZF1]|uniref:lytic transglycosylase domain-containing protein n=1 Tax=Photobacterium sp. BZF1 TaxID=1904457 RepID=UPI001653DF40|nr:lytic transglycosylase domain-containing protein [Photobacterium sp. BZF1]MBC7001589.1 lytic transglycosylase domain-containing protein [Photobacterium sp. BZF1]
MKIVTAILLFLFAYIFNLSQCLAQNRPPYQPIQAHLKVISPYKQPILRKFEEFKPVVNKITLMLKQRSLPSSLVLVPMLESSFNPQAVSPAKAAGLWQLMPATAKRFGLIVNSNRDQRFEIIPSTEAAIEYLTFLYLYFDKDINLTLAAYNAGEGRVSRAIKKSGSRAFSDLRLPKETIDYVYRFHALSYLIDISKLSDESKHSLWLFSTSSSNKKAFIDLSPLPPLISL